MAKTITVEVVLSDEEYSKLKAARDYLKQELSFTNMSLTETADYALVDWLASHVFEKGNE